MSLAIRPPVRVTSDRWPLRHPRAPAETRLERCVKLLPADVIALYLPAVGLGTLIEWRFYPFVIVAFATALVPLLLHLDARAAGDRAPSMQYLLRTLTFLAWAFVITPSISPVEPVVAAVASIAIPVGGEYLVRFQQRPW